jgi:replicative DNA helicase
MKSQLFTSAMEAQTHSLRSGELTLIAGRLSLGSSWVAMHLALEHGLRQGQPVHYFSNQPGGGKWIDQLPWLAANLGWRRKYEGKLDASEQAALKDAARLLDSAPIFCTESASRHPSYCIRTYLKKFRKISPAPWW